MQRAHACSWTLTFTRYLLYLMLPPSHLQILGLFQVVSLTLHVSRARIHTHFFIGGGKTLFFFRESRLLSENGPIFTRYLVALALDRTRTTVYNLLLIHVKNNNNNNNNNT